MSCKSLLPVTTESTVISRIRLNPDPFMIHETFLYLTETAFRSHPCRVVSATYRPLRPFFTAVTRNSTSYDSAGNISIQELEIAMRTDRTAARDCGMVTKEPSRAAPGLTIRGRVRPRLCILQTPFGPPIRIPRSDFQ